MGADIGNVCRILAINPGSTSTKLAVFQDGRLVSEVNLELEREELAKFKTIPEQYGLRMASIEAFLEAEDLGRGDFAAVAARGCGGGDQKSGAYLIDEGYLDLCRTNNIPHITSLSPLLAYDLAQKLSVNAYVYDADGVNEREPVSLLSGIKQIACGTGSHTLSAKAVARRAAEAVGKAYEDARVIVCHMGGGVSTSSHVCGRLADSTYDAFSPERAGGMPGSAMPGFLRLCFSGEYTQGQIAKMLMGGGGLVSYLGTSDVREVEARISAGDRQAEFYFDGMIYNLAKDIAAIASTTCFEVDVIALTGGLAYSDLLVGRLTERISKIAPVLRYPGSHEMEALAAGVGRVLRGEEAFHRLERSAAK